MVPYYYPRVADKSVVKQMRQMQLQPGELSLTRQHAAISTILGSCVSFTMRHANSGAAAMCHCLLATRPKNKPFSAETAKYSYLDSTLEEMVTFFRRSGADICELEVKLFGGSDVLQMLSGPSSVGRQNIQAAYRLIEHHGLNLHASDIGGPVGRKIIFHTDTGRVRVQKMRSIHERGFADATRIQQALELVPALA